MKIIVAPDSFKGSLSSMDAALAIERGIRRTLPDAVLIKVPMADGGEGSVDAMIAASGGKRLEATVVGPLGEQTEAYYGILSDNSTAVIEMAAASGLPLVPVKHRNPMITTTYGTGELIRCALDEGCRKIIVGIGGSATHDGGMGMAQALGIRFYDEQGALLGWGGKELERAAVIDMAELDPRIKETEIVVMSDVTNPICGERGAAAVYGPQKGADLEMVSRLDKGLAHFAKVIQKELSIDVTHLPGGGAAGGLGAGLVALLGATLRPGMEIIVTAADLETSISEASLVFTGEGSTDGQTAYGKVPIGLSEIAAKYSVPVVCLSGALGENIEELYTRGITAFFSIVDGPMTLEKAMDCTGNLLANAAENAVRLFAAGVTKGE